MASTTPPSNMTRQQCARVEALERARTILLGRTGQIVARTPDGPVDLPAVVELALFVLEGRVPALEAEDDVVDAVIGYDPGERLDDIRRAATIREAVGIAVGAASTCWERLEGTGVFDSTFASQITDALLERVTVPSPVPDDGYGRRGARVCCEGCVDLGPHLLCVDAEGHEIG